MGDKNGRIQISHCNTSNCPFTPTVAAVLALMGHDWIQKEKHRMEEHIAAINHNKGEVPETTKEAYLLISSLKEKLEAEMKRKST